MENEIKKIIMEWSNYLRIPEFLRISGKDVEKILLNLKLKKGSRVLDIGAAYGRITLFMKDKGYDTVACDNDTNMIKILKDKGLNAVLMDARSLKFKNNSFDLVITDGLLEHFKDIREIESIIKEELRVSRKYVLNFVPRDNFFNVVLEKLQGVPKEYRDRDWIKLHKLAVPKGLRKKYKLFVRKLLRLDAYVIEKINR